MKVWVNSWMNTCRKLLVLWCHTFWNEEIDKDGSDPLINDFSCILFFSLNYVNLYIIIWHWCFMLIWLLMCTKDIVNKSNFNISMNKMPKFNLEDFVDISGCTNEYEAVGPITFGLYLGDWDCLTLKSGQGPSKDTNTKTIICTDVNNFITVDGPLKKRPTEPTGVSELHRVVEVR